MGIYKISDEILVLEEYLRWLPPGAYRTYYQNASDTGIEMDTSGRNRLRRAAKRANIEYDCLRGEGIEMASPSNGLSIVCGRMGRVYQSTLRAQAATNNIIHSHYEAMTQQDKIEITRVGSIFGAMLATAEQMAVIRRERSRKEIPVNCVD